MSKKRIEKVWIERVIDDSPDLSWLGEYGETAKTEWAVDRQERGDQMRGEYRFWNPSSNHCPPGQLNNWKTVSDVSIAELCQQYDVYAGYERQEAIKALDLYYIEKDYQRCEAFNRGDWCMIGVIAKARVVSENGVIQTFRSGGLWGVESDSGKSYFAEIEQEELADLCNELLSFGFGARAITYALRRVERAD